MRFFSESGEYQRETATGVPSGWRAGANARTLLAALPVADEPARVGYDRRLFEHWDDTDHDGCDTRCEVVATERRADGTWFSWWDAKLVSVSGYLDIDHVVALAEAWDSGASGWNEAKRDAFADSQSNLVAVGQKVERDARATKTQPSGRRRERSRTACSRRSPSRRSSTGACRWTPPRRPALGALLDGCARATSAPPPVTGPPEPPRNVILYGDSISMETVSTFSWFLAQSGFRGVNRTFGGTAPCDWFSRMRERPVPVRPGGGGHAVLRSRRCTSCMKDRDVLPAYREDVRTATRIFIDAGMPVVWVLDPARRVSRDLGGGDQPDRAGSGC